MGNLNKRLERLEDQAEPPGKVRVVGIGSWEKTPEEREAEIVAARAAMGPNDTLIEVRYVDDWRGDRETEASNGQSEPTA